MGELHSALDGLAADDLFLLGDAGLLDRTAELVRARNRIDAELARIVRRAEAIQAPECDGLKSMKSWLRTHARLSGGAVGRLVDAGRALASLPVAETAFAAGEITAAEQVAVIAPITSPARLRQAAEQGVDVAGIETPDAAGCRVPVFVTTPRRHTGSQAWVALVGVAAEVGDWEHE